MHTIATAPSSYSPSTKGLGFEKISRGVEEPEQREAAGVVFGLGEVAIAPVFDAPHRRAVRLEGSRVWRLEKDGGPDCKKNRKYRVFHKSSGFKCEVGILSGAYSLDLEVVCKRKKQICVGNHSKGLSVIIFLYSSFKYVA
jgi:hypothetical protein